MITKSGLRLVAIGATLTGFVVSLLGHVAILLGVHTPIEPAMNSLLVFGVILWLGSGIEAYLLRRELRETGSSAMFRGAPPWMKWLAWAAAAYFALDFWLATGHWAGKVTPGDSVASRIASAAGMMVFAFPFAVFYAAYKRAVSRTVESVQ